MKKDRTQILTELRAFGIKNNIPNVTDAVARFLHMLILIKKPESILEIGCANGYSTIWLADAAEQVGAKVHTIDHSAPTFEQAKENIRQAGLSDCTEFYFGDAVEVLSAMPQPQRFDFVFVDGEKASYLDFWKAIEPRMPGGAVTVFDDMIAFPEKTGPFHDFIRSAEGVQQLLLPIDSDDGILLVIKQ